MAERNAHSKRPHLFLVYTNVLVCLILSLLVYLLARGTVSGMLVQSSIGEANWPGIDLAVSIASLIVVVGLAAFNLWFFPRAQKKKRLLLWGLVEAGILLAIGIALVFIQTL